MLDQTGKLLWLNLCKRSVCFIVLTAMFGCLSEGQESDSRYPIPSESALEAAEKVVQEVYGGGLAKAKSKTEKQALAATLLDKAKQTADDLASRYVLMRLSLELSTQASDMQQAFRIVDRIAEEFEIEKNQQKAAVLLDLAAKARDSALHKSLSEEALKLLDHALHGGDIVAAEILHNLAMSEAKKARDKQLQFSAKKRSDDIRALEKVVNDSFAGKKVLQSDSADPEANLAVGTGLCFIEEDWDKGLELLALGSDEDLRKVAVLESSRPTSVQERVRVGDAWWEIGDKAEGWKKKKLMMRARYWYRLALPSLSGINRDRLNKRIDKILELGLSDREMNGKWMLVFRSSDPSVWNTDSRDPNRFAIPISAVPEDIKYLKMQMDSENAVIIPMSKQIIGTRKSFDLYGWEGSNQVVWGGRQLGIYDKSIIIGHQGYLGGPCIWWENGGGLTGYGFGYVPGANVQGWGWDGKSIGEKSIEILVTSESLSSSEKKSLLKD